MKERKLCKNVGQCVTYSNFYEVSEKSDSQVAYKEYNLLLSINYR